MTNNTSAAEILIGGLAAEKFAGRPIKVDFEDNRDCPCKCVGVDTKRGTVVVIANEKGRRVSVHVEAKQCHPWWSKNPDLKVVADTKGVTFSGEVSVGRALAEAIKPLNRQVEDQVGKYMTGNKYKASGNPFASAASAAPVIRSIPVPEPEPVAAIEEVPAVMPEPEPVAEIEEAPEPEPVETIEEEPAATQPKPVVFRPLRKLVGIEVPVDVPDSWVDDYREYKRIAASSEPARLEIERMQAAIALLEAEQEDNKLLLDLHIEQLEAQGIILKWDTSQDVVEAPAGRELVRSERYPMPDAFLTQFRDWLAGNPPEITFKSIFEGLRLKDNPIRRIWVKNILTWLDYQILPTRSGGPVEFCKPSHNR
jgi:hypothetical protein